MSQNLPLLSFVIVTRNRKDDLREAIVSILRQHYRPLEIVVVDNASDDGTAQMLCEEFSDPCICYVRLSENRGVTGGRNVSITEARGDILITLDDDCVFRDPEAASVIVEKFQQDERLGVLAFRIVNYFTNCMAKDEFPHRDKTLDSKSELETSYFIGAGHAVRKAVYQHVGLYPENFFYGMEELDLSFRILDAGYKILYFPQVYVLHKRSPNARISDLARWQRMLENRVRTSIRNLPWRYVLGSGVIWSGKVLWETRGRIDVIVRVFGHVIMDFRELKRERSPIKPQTLRRLQQLRGRLWW